MFVNATTILQWEHIKDTSSIIMTCDSSDTQDKFWVVVCRTHQHASVIPLLLYAVIRRPSKDSVCGQRCVDDRIDDKTLISPLLLF